MCDGYNGGGSDGLSFILLIYNLLLSCLYRRAPQGAFLFVHLQ